MPSQLICYIITIMTSHDHTKCIKDCTTFAHDIAAHKGKKLTKQRLQVLQILLRDHKALGAYDILEKMRDGLAAGQSIPQPPTVYRALDFLLDLELIHKVESQNRFYACTVEKINDEHHMAQAFICDNCGLVEEKIAQNQAQNLFDKANAFGFEIKQVIMECRGTCAICLTGGVASE